MTKPCFEVYLELDPLNEEFELTTEPSEDFTIYAIEEENSDILLDLTDEEEYSLDILDIDILDFILESGSAIVNYVEGEIYDGEYHVTPSQALQTLLTANRVLLQNIIIDAIPSNYGLIEWDGSIMRIS